MQRLAPERRFRAAMKQGWTRLVSAARPQHYRLPYRRRPGEAAIELPAAGAPPSPSLLDPVALTVMAVNRLGPATLRTVANGKPLTVTVPDAQVGAIFKAALAEMQKTRCTDRLIDIVIAADGVNATGGVNATRGVNATGRVIATDRTEATRAQPEL